MVFEPEENRRTNENRQAEDLPRLCHVLLNGSPYPMAAVQGADHILRYVNPAFCRLVGKPCEELTGTPAARAMPEGEACVLLLDQTLHLATQLEPRPKRSETDPLLWPYVMWAIPGAGVQPMGIMIQVTDPVVTPLVSKRMTEMNQELILGAVYQHEQAEAARELNRRLREENTEHQYTEETLKEGLEAMERGRLMAEGASLAKSDYLAHISHELRTPLTAMLGLSEMLQDAAEGIQDKHFATDLAKIRDAGGYLLKLISGILDMSKMEAGKMPVCLDTFRVHDLLQSVVE